MKISLKDWDVKKKRFTNKVKKIKMLFKKKTTKGFTGEKMKEKKM